MRAQDAAEDRILDVLLPPAKDQWGNVQESDNNSTRQTFRKKLREGQLDDKEIEIDVAAQVSVEIMTPPGMEEMTSQLQSLFEGMSPSKTKNAK